MAFWSPERITEDSLAADGSDLDGADRLDPLGGGAAAAGHDVRRDRREAREVEGVLDVEACRQRGPTRLVGDIELLDAAVAEVDLDRLDLAGGVTDRDRERLGRTGLGPAGREDVGPQALGAAAEGRRHGDGDEHDGDG